VNAVVLQSIASLGTIVVGLAAISLSAYTRKVSLHHQAAEAQRARLWERRSAVYVEVLNTLQGADLQEWAIRGSVSWERMLSSELHGKILAFGSLDVRLAWTDFVFAQTRDDRKSALAAIERAAARDLQGDGPDRRTWLTIRRKVRGGERHPHAH
jgi:hypothetical protein